MVTPGPGGDVDLDDTSTRHEHSRFPVGNRFLGLGPLSLVDAAQFRRDGGVIVDDGHQRRRPRFLASNMLGCPGGFNGGGAGGGSIFASTAFNVLIRGEGETVGGDRGLQVLGDDRLVLGG